MLWKSPQQNVPRWFAASVASVVNRFLTGHGNGVDIEGGRPSQPYCYGMSELLPFIEHVFISHRYR